jgi:hypothetical protein
MTADMAMLLVQLPHLGEASIHFLVLVLCCGRVWTFPKQKSEKFKKL